MPTCGPPVAPRAAPPRRRVDLSLRSRRVGPSLEALQEGQVVRGTVKRCAQFGVFVELDGAPGVTGERAAMLACRRRRERRSQRAGRGPAVAGTRRAAGLTLPFFAPPPGPCEPQAWPT